MIVECPKCQTKFEVSDEVVKKNSIKFQCAECAFVWTFEGKDKEDASQLVDNVLVEQKNEQVVEDKLPSVFSESNNNANVNLEKFSVREWLSPKILMLCGLALLVGLVLFLLVRTLADRGTNGDGKTIFGAERVEKVKQKKLYIELVKPLISTKEGNNEYIIIRGYVYNPTDVEMNVPKLVIKLRNKDGRILQEQEREIEVKSLASLDKTDFMFKVFKYSPLVTSVEVDFVEPDKI